jgi:hypothetical protein
MSTMQATVGVLGVLVIGAVAVVPAALLVNAAPLHSNLVWSGRVLALSFGIAAIWLALCVLAATMLWRAELRMAAQLAAIVGIAGAIVAWKAVGAANVVFDRSPAEQREVTFVRHVGATSKQAGYLVVSDANGELALYLPLRADAWQPGRRLVLVTRAGALGRAYALSVDAAN